VLQTHPTVHCLAASKRLLTDLHEKGLLQLFATAGAGPVETPPQGTEAANLERRPQYLISRLPGWDPERTLEWLHGLTWLGFFGPGPSPSA